MDLIKHIYGHCFNPQQVQILNPVTREKEIREVPCGKCYHCRITKVNEWCTRMVLESKARKYTYFCTLTYSSRSEHTEIFRETYAQRNTINTYGKLQNMPLVLRKDHLQKFFKRLRRNTGIKFKYFACGEYGSTYARPHYHFILWSDDPVSKIDIYRAWSTVDDYGRRIIIGNVDYNLIADNHLMNDKQMAAFKYVCKYLQKGDFDFKKLPTYKFHQKLKVLLYDYKGFVEGVPTQSMDTTDSLYRKRFSPFMLCSKSPAIGFDYLSENLARFKTGDFRLFGLRKDQHFILPTYYVRKTKEALCPYCRINETTENLRTNATIPDLVSMLVEIQNCIDFVQDFCPYQQLVNYLPSADSIVFDSTKVGTRRIRLGVRYFTIYDNLRREWYEFDGTDYRVYRKTRKGVENLYRISVQGVLTRLQDTYKALYDNLLYPMTNSRVHREKTLQDYIDTTYGDSWPDVQATYRSAMMSKVDSRQAKYNQTKNKF